MDNRLIYSVIGFLGVQGVTLIAFLIRYIWNSKSSEIKDNTELTRQNTLALQMLTLQMNKFEEKLELVGELYRDVQKLGQKVRTIKTNGKPKTN